MTYLLSYNMLEWTIRVVMAVVIIRRRMSTGASLAWLVIVMVHPPLGLVVYLLLGRQWLGKRRVRDYSLAAAAARSEDRLTALQSFRQRPQIGDDLLPMILQAERISGNPIVGGNALDLIADTDEKIDRLIADIDAAEHHVHLLYFIYRSDATGRRVSEALQRAARRGVACRLLVDAVGSRRFLGVSGLLAELHASGVRVAAALPVAPFRRKLARIDLRNHRKLAVIDGRIGYTGSQNIVDADYGHKKAGTWMDLSGRFTGPIVQQLQLVFLGDWESETDEHLQSSDLFPPLKPTGDIAAQCVPTGPSQESETFRRVLIAALNASRRRIIITSPYLVPDEPTMLALTMATDRGVEVQIVVPEHSDHPLVAAAGRAFFDDLLDAGITIHRYRGGMLHAKTITVDDAFALLGSANLDIRSFYLNFEINVLLYGPAVTSMLRFAQTRYLSESVRIDPNTWAQRSTLRRFADDSAALLAPLL